MLCSIRQIAVTVSNVDAALQFYRDILGIPFLFSAGTELAFLDASGAKQERAPALAAKMPDHELWTGFLKDPDGNLVGLMEEKR